MKFEVIESKVYKNIVSGKTASIYGAHPEPGNPAAWMIVSRGWTVKNPHTGQVGICRAPWATRKEAQDYADANVPSKIGYGD